MRRLTILAITSIVACAAATAQRGGLPPVPVPPENPITPAKTNLGHMLFWDEQLSSDNSIACGTCHQNRSGGADPVSAPHPGPDGQWRTPDDIHASFGVVHSDSNFEFDPDPIFGFDRQVTGRAAPSAITSQYARAQFWDGRAGPTFVDPQTGAMRIADRGSLENQALGPILSTAEMGHEGRDWPAVFNKLNRVRPMALASDLPARIAAALNGGPDYGELFRRAFGDRRITATRIAFAIATYERSLVANQTPFDLNTMTPNQRRGFDAFRNLRCDACHRPPFFTDHSFRNLGLRPAREDNGRESVTNNPIDRGRFKVPSLRGAGQRVAFMHNGALDSLNRVLDFYDHRIPFFQANRDPILERIRVPLNLRPQLLDFLENALTDPRTVAGSFPFDRPTLRSERLRNRTFGLGSGPSGRIPLFLSRDPAYAGSVDLRFGIGRARPGAVAILALSDRGLPAPRFIGGIAVNVELSTAVTEPLLLRPGQGYGTLPAPVPNDPGLHGVSVFTQWFVVDPTAPGGVASSRGVEFPIE